MRNRFVRVLFSLASLAVGCGGDGGAGGSIAMQNSALTSDSGGTSSQTAAIATLAVDPLAAGFTNALDAATKAQAALKNAFANPSCATAQVDGVIPSKVNVTLSACSGPYGLRSVSGQLAITYADQGSGVTVQLASQNLNVDGGTLQLAAVVTVANKANARSVSVQTTTQATTANGNTYQHAGSFNATWDAAMCLSLDGQFATVKDNRQLATIITGYKRCKMMCPQAGSVQLAFSDLGAGDAGTLQITYDGSSSAKVTQTSSKGVVANGSIALTCG